MSESLSQSMKAEEIIKSSSDKLFSSVRDFEKIPKGEIILINENYKQGTNDSVSDPSKKVSTLAERRNQLKAEKRANSIVRDTNHE
jgi:hypothetical protein